ncbi:MAG TPA: ATP-binding protein [Luteimonas sp.]|nr:ATP-binding protein [Luteimonas sp.]
MAAWAALSLCIALPAQAQVALTPAEREWVQHAPPVVVGVQSDYAPFSFVDGNGRVAGYSNELFQLAASKVGLRYRLAAAQPWDILLRQAHGGQVDVLTCLWKTPERERFLDFVSPPYLHHGLGWAVRIADPAPPNDGNTRGKVIAIARDFAVNPTLRRRFPQALYVEVDSAADALRLVSLGKADGYVDNIGLINYVSAQQGFANLRVRDVSDLPGTDYYMAVTRVAAGRDAGDQAMLQAVLGKGLQAVGESERRRLEDRWLHESLPLQQVLRPYLARAVLGLLLLALVVGWLVRSNRRLACEVALRREFEAAAQERAAELARREVFQRSLLDAAQAAILVLNAQGRWIVFNRFAEQLLGWDADEILGKVVRTREEAALHADSSPFLIDPEQSKRSLALIQDVIGHAVAGDWRALYLFAELRQPPQQVDLIHKDGHRVPVVLSLAHVADREGRPAGLIAIANDLSEQKRLEHDLRASEARAREANAAKSAFLAAMSHEIRTPMIGITGMVEILAHSALDDDQRHALGIMESSTQALLDVLGDILDFSKIEADRIEIRPVATDVGKLVERAVASFAGAASSKGLTIASEVDARIAPAYRVDPQRLRQIVNNFLSNAIKFTDSGGVDVVLEWQGASGDADRLSVRVRDSGIGISREQQARLFQPFAQAEGDTTRRYAGTGLGLAISRRLAELMGGRVTLVSAPGEGTTLELSLSLARAAASEVVDDAVMAGDGFAAQPAPSIAEAERMRSLVLLVDDHPTNRMVIARQLALAGYAVVPVADGQQALAQWRTGRFALVLTDVHMPLMDGYALAGAIREEEARSGGGHVPIVALTASALKGEAERCKAAGMDDYLAKPVGVSALAATLQRWLPHTAPVGAPAAARVSIPAAIESGATLDRSVLEAVVGSDPATLHAVLDDFFASVDDDSAALDAAIDQRDLSSLTRHAHRIKGAARLVGALALADVAGELEAAGLAGAWMQVDALRARLQAAERALRRDAGQMFERQEP